MFTEQYYDSYAFPPPKPHQCSSQRCYPHVYHCSDSSPHSCTGSNHTYTCMSRHMSSSISCLNDPAYLNGEASFAMSEASYPHNKPFDCTMVHDTQYNHIKGNDRQVDHNNSSDPHRSFDQHRSIDQNRSCDQIKSSDLNRSLDQNKSIDPNRSFNQNKFHHQSNGSAHHNESLYNDVVYNNETFSQQATNSQKSAQSCVSNASSNNFSSASRFSAENNGSVHILPETVVTGAAILASSALNTARNVLNMIVPPRNIEVCVA